MHARHTSIHTPTHTYTPTHTRTHTQRHHHTYKFSHTDCGHYFFIIYRCSGIDQKHKDAYVSPINDAGKGRRRQPSTKSFAAAHSCGAPYEHVCIYTHAHTRILQRAATIESCNRVCMKHILSMYICIYRH